MSNLKDKWTSVVRDWAFQGLRKIRFHERPDAQIGYGVLYYKSDERKYRTGVGALSGVAGTRERTRDLIYGDLIALAETPPLEIVICVKNADLATDALLEIPDHFHTGLKESAGYTLYYEEVGGLHRKKVSWAETFTIEDQSAFAVCGDKGWPAFREHYEQRQQIYEERVYWQRLCEFCRSQGIATSELPETWGRFESYEVMLKEKRGASYG